MSPLLALLIMLFKADVFLTAAALLFATTPFFVTSIALLGTGSGVASLIFAPVFLIFVLFPDWLWGYCFAESLFQKIQNYSEQRIDLLKYANLMKCRENS